MLISKIQYDAGQPAVWVIGGYTGDKAKSILAHAREGINYFILKEDGRQIVAGFRIPEPNGPLPDNIKLATPDQCKKLDLMFASRHQNQVSQEQAELFHKNDYKPQPRRDWM